MSNKVFPPSGQSYLLSDPSSVFFVETSPGFLSRIDPAETATYSKERCGFICRRPPNPSLRHYFNSARSWGKTVVSGVQFGFEIAKILLCDPKPN